MKKDDGFLTQEEIREGKFTRDQIRRVEKYFKSKLVKSLIFICILTSLIGIHCLLQYPFDIYFIFLVVVDILFVYVRISMLKDREHTLHVLNQHLIE